MQQVWIKDEAQNPTGSFKDRGLSVAVSRAKELGVKKLRFLQQETQAVRLPPTRRAPASKPMSLCPRTRRSLTR